MLTINPAKRITAHEALKHPWVCVSVPSALTPLLTSDGPPGLLGTAQASVSGRTGLWG